MIYGIVLGLHVLICIILVLVVLLQSSKGTGLAGGAFGGGADTTVFGGRGAATVLSKATTIFGAAFMITSLTLTLLGTTRDRGPRSVVAEEAAQQAPLGLPGGTEAPGAAPGGSALPFEAGPTAPDAGGAAPVAPPPSDGAGGDAGGTN